MLTQSSKSITHKNHPFVSIGSYIYSQTNQLGSGYQSVVYKATHRIKKFDVALKIIEIEKIDNGINKNLLNSQLKCLEVLQKTPGILNMLQVIKTEKFIYVVTELCKGDLGGRNPKIIPEMEAWSYIKQMIKSYKYLYEKGIVHRDLKPDNLFIKEIGQIKIGDFGFAAPLSQAQRQSNYNIGSPNYMAPQILHKNQYSHASDIWAIGISFYELLTGNVPWVCQSQTQMMEQLTPQSISQKIQNASISQRSKSFLKQILCYQSTERIKPQQLFQFQLIDNCYEAKQKKFNYSVYQKNSTQSTNISKGNTSLKNTDSKNSLRSYQSRSEFDDLTDQILKKQTDTHKKNYHKNSDKCRKISHDFTFTQSQKILQQQYKNNQQPVIASERSLITNPFNTAFKKKNKTEQLQNQSSNFSIEQIDQIINGYLQCCKFIYQFLQHNKKGKQNVKMENQFNVFKNCLKNFIINTMEKIQNIDRSVLLSQLISKQQITKYLKSQHYTKTKQSYKQLRMLYEKNEQLQKYWQLTKQQKPKIILNSAVNLINIMKTILQSQKNNKYLFQICQFAFKIIQIFNYLFKQKYITLEVIVNIVKIKKKIISNQYLMKKIGEIQKLK